MRRTLLRGAFIAATLWISFTAVSRSQPTELFFSEYIEGSSNNKALEVFNGTGAAINLGTGGYNIQMFFNGSSTAGLTINLTGTVAAGDVFVLAQSSANATILAQADQTNGAGWFNGDDAVVLRKATTVLDVIGQIGFDPGTEWGTGLTSTADNTLRRKCTVTMGDANGSNVFDPSVEWDGFATDTFNALGSHCVTGPTGLGAANPNIVEPGEMTLLTVTVTPGTNPASTGITVTGDLNSIGGSASQSFFDDGMNGDSAPGDNVFTHQVTVAFGTSPGNKSIPVTVADAQARSSMTSISLAVVTANLAIHDIQGAGSSSPYAGQFVGTTGIVTARKFNNGFFIQDPAPDADPSTSEGIFIFTSSAPPAAAAIGNSVSVAGTVVEFIPSADPHSPPLTEIGGSPTVTVLSTGNPLPAPTPLTAADTSPAGSNVQLE
jgi:predicted extracellular nuclease